MITITGGMMLSGPHCGEYRTTRLWTSEEECDLCDEKNKHVVVLELPYPGTDVILICNDCLKKMLGLIEEESSTPRLSSMPIKPATPYCKEMEMTDPWDRKTGFCCATCAFYAPKNETFGRCRRHAPTMQGYPVVYAEKDWCGDHKIGDNPTKEQTERKITCTICGDQYGPLDPHICISRPAPKGLTTEGHVITRNL